MRLRFPAGGVGGGGVRPRGARHYGRIRAEAAAWLRRVEIDPAAPHRSFTALVLESAADLAILPVQDVLGLGSEARMNTPGTISGNWSWRLRAGALLPEAQDELRVATERADRLGRRVRPARRSTARRKA